MRFRKRVKIFPGFYLNFSSSGISSTIGVKGASINFSKRGTYLNTSIPGTGFYDRQKIDGPAQGHNQYQPVPPEQVIIPQVQVQQPLPGEIRSDDAEQLTSASFAELKDSLSEVYKDRIELTMEIRETIAGIQSAKNNYVIACIFLIGFFFKSFKNKIREKEEYLQDLEKQLRDSFINIDVYFDHTYAQKYNQVCDAYKALLTSAVTWDITSSVKQDMKATRSAASYAVTRVPVRFKLDHIDIIRSCYPAFHFENKNGGDLYIYPAFVIMSSIKKEFGVIDIKDIELAFSPQRFLEEERIPPDATVIDRTWAKVNKNGSPDKRFANNYEIPIVRYGELGLRSASGLNESYMFSSFEKSHGFANALIEYKNLL